MSSQLGTDPTLSTPSTDRTTERRLAAMDDALDRLRAYRFTDGPGMAVHGPMGAEALAALGEPGAVAAWADGYARRHPPIDAPPASLQLDATDEASWRPALGDPGRLTDWAALFTRLLAEEPWPAVVARWVPRLVDGYGGALTHGLLRTAHAVRTVGAGPAPSELALGELAMGLAYWAGSYRPLPGDPRPAGTLSVPSALAAVPRPVEPWSPMEAGTFARMDELEGFPQAVDALAAPTGPDPLGDLSLAFASVLLDHPEAPATALVHTVTPVVASRALLPYVPALSAEALYARLWQVDAAIVAGFVRPGPEPGAEPGPARDDTRGGSVPLPDTLVGRAVEHGDPHVVKFTEACLREHARHPDDTYLLAAQRVVEVTAPW